MQIFCQRHLLECILDQSPIPSLLVLAQLNKQMASAVECYVRRNTLRVRVSYDHVETQFRGKPHSLNDNAAVIRSGNKSWCRFGRIYRNQDQPAQQLKDGSKLYYCQARLHRKTGPAIVYCGGWPGLQGMPGTVTETPIPEEVLESLRKQLPQLLCLQVPFQAWIEHGLLHRIGAPAVLSKDGDEFWLVHGQLHRKGRPAIVRPLMKTGEPNQYWINGIRQRSLEARKI